MFIRYFTELPLPRRLVEEALLREPAEWLPGLLEAACGRMREMLSDVGLGGPDRAGGRPTVEIGPARFRADRTVLSIARRGAGGPADPPELTGDIEIAALGASRTHLSMSALCDPPEEAFAAAADRFLFHRVVEAAVKDFLDRAREAIEGRAGPSCPTALGRRAS